MRELELMMGGADGRFKPEDLTQRAQAIAVIARTLRLQDAEPAARDAASPVWRIAPPFARS